ncbi:MAG: hypothetical protein ACRD9W_20485, partial [Terriglobia bacterium]
MPSLSRDQREEVIREPIKRAGGSIDKNLVERLLNDAPDALDQLPVLQHCLQQLWEHSGDQHHLRLADYTEIGGVSTALSRHADKILKNLAGSEAVVEKVFRALGEIDRGGRMIRRACHFAELEAETGEPPDKLRTILDRFRDDDCSFLTPSKSDVSILKDDFRIDVGHEALLRRWEKIGGVPGATGEPNDPRPVGWLREEEADGRRYQALLSLAQSPGKTVLPHEQIAWWDKFRPSTAWTDRYGGGHHLVEGLIESSRASIAADQEYQRKQIATQRTRRLAIAAVVIASVIGAVAVFAFVKQQQVIQQNRFAIRQQIIAAKNNEALGIANFAIARILASLNEGDITAAAAQGWLETILANKLLNGPIDISQEPEIAALKANVLIIYSDAVST